MKIRINNLLSILIVFFSVSTLLTTFVEFLNKFLGLFIFLCVLYYAIKYCNRKTGIIYLGLLISSSFTFIMTRDIAKNLNECIYWILTVLIFVLCTDERFIYKICEGFQFCDKFIKFILYLCSALLVFGFFDNNCYSSLWQGGYFVGYSHSAHSLCSGCCILLALTLLIFRENNISVKEIVLFAIPSVAILKSGARTFLIPLIVIWIIIYIRRIKSKSIKTLLFPIAVIFGIYILSNTNMFRKILYALQDTYTSNVVLESFTSGRMIFWKIDLVAFLNSGFIQQLIGHGFSYIFELNLQEYGKYIWGHNDIITILLSCGILGLAVYVGSIFYHYNNITRFNKINKALLMIYLLFPLVINGLYEYQHFLYSYIIVLSYFTLEIGYEKS